MGLVILDALLIFACFLFAAYIVFTDVTDIYLLDDGGRVSVSIGAVTILLGLYVSDLYTELRMRSLGSIFLKVTLVIGAVFIVQALLAYMSSGFALPQTVILIASPLILVLFPPWRQLYTSVLYKGFGIDRLLFLGTDLPGMEIAEYVAERPQMGFVTVGFADDVMKQGDRIAGVRILGTVAELPDIVASTRPDRIIVNLAERRQALPVDLLLDLRFSGIRIEEASLLYEEASRNRASRSSGSAIARAMLPLASRGHSVSGRSRVSSMPLPSGSAR